MIVRINTNGKHGQSSIIEVNDIAKRYGQPSYYADNCWMIMGWKSGRQDGIILATFNSEEDCDVELDRLTKELKAVIVQEV